LSTVYILKPLNQILANLDGIKECDGTPRGDLEVTTTAPLRLMAGDIDCACANFYALAA